jgi:ubiquinone/menaquinone biosynthesis C-methylase UbiE
LCLGCNSKFAIEEGIPILLPEQLEEFKKLEAEYHTKEACDYAKINMIFSLRVERYHDKFLKYLHELPTSSVVFEVAGGDGNDAQKLIQSGLTVVQTDISLGMVKTAKSNLKNSTIDNTDFIVCDAERLPCKNSSVDAIMIVGALHHLPSPEIFFIEAKRALKPGGLLIIGFEPNICQYKFVYPILKKIHALLYSGGKVKPSQASIGDQETNGFSNLDFWHFAKNAHLEVIDLQRIWYINGFIHTVLTHLNNKRSNQHQIDLPRSLQKIIVVIDELISYIPYVRNLCWHWTCVIRKS